MKTMSKILFTTLLINIFAAISAFCANIPADLTDDVSEAVTNGKLLFDSYSRGPVSDAELLEKINIQKTKINDICEFEYHPYVVNSNNKEIIYFIAQSPKENHIVFGRHFKIVNDVSIASTKSCFVSPPPPPNTDAVGAFVTHLLSDAPTEFHVFISLQHSTPLYVGTARGIWKVENGAIELLEERRE